MTMNYQIDLQNASTQAKLIPNEQDFKSWVLAALQEVVDKAEVTIRLVDEEEGAKLNQTFRNKPYATNVLSFPFFDSQQFGLDLLGDIVICVPVVLQEAHDQNKAIASHFAHMVVHGVLHLLGYDHIQDDDAQEMEGLEIKILGKLGFPNPYQEEHLIHD